MACGKSPAERQSRRQKRLGLWTDPYLWAWMALTPAERLRRAWRLRSRFNNLQAIHDAKSLPSFERSGLEYLLFSGQAAILHGAATFSEDIDISIQRRFAAMPGGQVARGVVGFAQRPAITASTGSRPIRFGIFYLGSLRAKRPICHHSHRCPAEWTVE